MLTIAARNAQDALRKSLTYLDEFGIARSTRAGDVIVLPTPVTTQYSNPTELCVFWQERDANPFFHLFEGLWMLAGRNDVDWIAQFNKNIANFSDDGETFHGAYGQRWRATFGFDQYKALINNLETAPNCRRQVLTMWYPPADLLDQANKKDLPCNTHAYFWQDCGELNMTVCCRSNDVVWGCYGSDSVTFGLLLQFIAEALDLEVGKYWQMSNNWHAYKKTIEPLGAMAGQLPYDPYATGTTRPFPRLMKTKDWMNFMVELQMFIDQGEAALGYREPFIKRVALPMLRAWRVFKSEEAPARYELAIKELSNCQAPDWRYMCTQWIERRHRRWMSKKSST